MRLVQRLQARMPDRRGHGTHEDRVPRPLQSKAWPERARPGDWLSAALRAVGRAPGTTFKCWFEAVATATRVFAKAQAAQVAHRFLHERRKHGLRRGPVRRYLQ